MYAGIVAIMDNASGERARRCDIYDALDRPCEEAITVWPVDKPAYALVAARLQRCRLPR